MLKWKILKLPIVDARRTLPQCSVVFEQPEYTETGIFHVHETEDIEEFKLVCKALAVATLQWGLYATVFH